MNTPLLPRAVRHQIPDWAADLAKQTMQVELLVDNLPDLASTEEQQLARLAVLEADNRAAGDALLAEVRKTGTCERLLQSCHSDVLTA